VLNPTTSLKATVIYFYESFILNQNKYCIMKKILLFLLVTCVAFYSSLSAATLTVGTGGTYATIQAAVDAANSGDVILVSAGTYNEMVIVTKSLSILGPNESISPNGLTSRNPEAIVAGQVPFISTIAIPFNEVFRVNTPGVEVAIRGFTIKNGEALTDGHASPVVSNKPSVTFEKNIVLDAKQIYNGYVWGDVTIRDNRFTNSTPASAIDQDAIYILSGNNVVIQKNVINNTYLGILVKGDVNNIVNNADISENKISNTQQEGIQIGFILGTALVSQNEIDHAGLTSANDGGINIYQPTNSGQLTVRNNTVTNTRIGLAVKTETAAYSGLNDRIIVIDNSFDLTNAIAIHNMLPSSIPGSLQATCNWLGKDCPTDRVIGAVTYSPWLKTGVDGSSEMGFQRGNNVCGVGDLSLTKVEEDAKCFGGSGSVTIKIVGCSPPFTYHYTTHLSPEIPVVGNQFTQSLPAGSFTFYVTDAAGQTKDISVTIGGAAQLQVNPSSTNPLCAGQLGSITLSATGGTGTKTYSLNGVSPVSNFSNNTGVFVDLPVNTYNYSVTDINNCGPVTGSITITAPPAITLTSAAITHQISCNGTNDGQITIAANGGTGTITYNLTGGTLGVSGAANTTGIFSGLGAGTYSYSTKDANNCAGPSGSLQIIAPPAIVASGAITGVPTCTSAVGQITITASGGTGTLNYTLQKVGGSATGPQSSNVFSGLGVGSYSFTVKDANNCTFNSTSNIELVATSGPTGSNATVTSNYNGSQVSCVGSSDGKITVSVTGGVANYTFHLGGLTQNTGASSFEFTGLPAGTYNYFVVDANGCQTATKQVTISNPQALSVTKAEVTEKPNCNATSKGKITIEATGGTGSLQYSLMNTGTNVTSGPQASGVFNGLSAGTYSYKVVDANGCTVNSSTNLVITQDGGPTSVSATVTTNLSCVGSTNGAITVTATGGTTPYTFTLTGPTATTPNTTGVFTGLAAGNYSYSVKDANGCEKNGTPISLSSPAAITATPIITPPSNCSGPANGTVQVSASGGTGTKSVTLNGETKNSPATFTGLASGSYPYTITDANQCSITGTVVVGPNTANCGTPCTFVYGGFEGGTNTVTTAGSATSAGTDLKLGLPPIGTYQVVKKVGDLGGGGYLNVTPRTGQWFMGVHTSNNASDRIWYKSMPATAGQMYQFCVGVTALKKIGNGENFILAIYANGQLLQQIRVTESWQQLCGTYTVKGSDNGKVEWSIRDPKKGQYFAAIDDVCLTLTSGTVRQSTQPAAPVTKDVKPSVQEVVSATNILDVKVLTNPSATSFKLMITGSDEKVTMDVVDQLGRRIQVLSNLKSNSTITIGKDYPVGSYFAVIVQGDSKKVVKLVKVRN
jgi:hypothetical protein